MFCHIIPYVFLVVLSIYKLSHYMFCCYTFYHYTFSHCLVIIRFVVIHCVSESRQPLSTL
jgi:hypothetical protein